MMVTGVVSRGGGGWVGLVFCGAGRNSGVTFVVVVVVVARGGIDPLFYDGVIGLLEKELIDVLDPLHNAAGGKE